MNRESFVIKAFGDKSSFIGDDAAVVGNLLYSQDAFFENVHFKASWMSYYQIAYKAMMINLSDAIAMNAQPKYALLTLAIPKSMAKDDLNDLMQGLHDGASLYGCEIIGGDTIANSKLDISITIVSESDNILQRHTVREGDILAFTGTLGRSKRELQRLFRGGRLSSKSRFVRPVLRQKMVSKSYRHLHSGMDISDGLYEDSRKLTAMIDRSFKPCRKLSRSLTCSGEEYEMLLSFSPRKIKTLKRIAAQTRTPLTLFAKVGRASKKALCKSNHF